MGERRTDELLKHLPPGTVYVGVGVGRRWNRAFMKAAAERTGGVLHADQPGRADRLAHPGVGVDAWTPRAC